MPIPSKLLLSGLTLVAAYLRLPALFANHYHADEALFSSWARLIAVLRDPLLATQAVDKPPLLFYFQALFYPLMGPEEWASRLPNLIASILLVPLTAVLAWRLYRSPTTSLLAGLVVAVSPMAIQYGATAFTDPLLSFLLILALFLIITPTKPLLAGLAFGLAAAAKYQAWLFLPLLAGFAWLFHWDRRLWCRWLAGFLPLLLLLFIWEMARAGSLQLWSNQIGNFGGLRLIYSWELLSRLHSWTMRGQVIFGSSLLYLSFCLILFALLLRGAQKRERTGQIDLLLIIFLAAYMIFHWLVAVPVWDRYLLPVIPLIALLIAHGLALFFNWMINLQNLTLPRRLAPFLIIMTLLAFSTIPAVGAARAGQWLVGGYPSADQGAWQIAAHLQEEPYGTVLYDHWYSWHWRYHLFDKGVYVSWFPDPDALAGDLKSFGDGEGSRYIVLPGNGSAAPIRRAVSEAGFDLEEVVRTDMDPGMILYQLRQLENIEQP